MRPISHGLESGLLNGIAFGATFGEPSLAARIVGVVVANGDVVCASALPMKPDRKIVIKQTRSMDRQTWLSRCPYWDSEYSLERADDNRKAKILARYASMALRFHR